MLTTSNAIRAAIMNKLTNNSADIMTTKRGRGPDKSQRTRSTSDTSTYVIARDRKGAMYQLAAFAYDKPATKYAAKLADNLSHYRGDIVVITANPKMLFNGYFNEWKDTLTDRQAEQVKVARVATCPSTCK